MFNRSPEILNCIYKNVQQCLKETLSVSLSVLLTKHLLLLN